MNLKCLIISNNDKQYLCAFYIYKALRVDLQKKSDAQILMNAEIHVNFHLQTINTQIRCALVS